MLPLLSSTYSLVEYMAINKFETGTALHYTAGRYGHKPAFWYSTQQYHSSSSTLKYHCVRKSNFCHPGLVYEPSYRVVLFGAHSLLRVQPLPSLREYRHTCASGNGKHTEAVSSRLAYL